jgi:hypothetical protein
MTEKLMRCPRWKTCEEICSDKEVHKKDEFFPCERPNKSSLCPACLPVEEAKPELGTCPSCGQVMGSVHACPEAPLKRISDEEILNHIKRVTQKGSRSGKILVGFKYGWKRAIYDLLNIQLASALKAHNAIVAPLIEENKKLRDCLSELVDLMEDVRTGNYSPDSFTTQPAKRVLGGS